MLMYVQMSFFLKTFNYEFENVYKSKNIRIDKMDLQNCLAEHRKPSNLCKTHILNYFFYYALGPFFANISTEFENGITNLIFIFKN